MSLLQFFRIIWARRAIVLVAILASIFAAILIGKLLPTRYTANSRVMLDLIRPDPITGEVIASGASRGYIKTQTELVRDYRIAGRAADILGWTASPVLAAQYRNRPPEDTRDFRRWVAQRVIDGTNVKMIDASNILEISYTTSTPEAAAKVADAIRRAYVDQAIAFKREDAGDNAVWFTKQAQQVREKLNEAEKRKGDFESANGIILDADNVDQESKRLSALAASTQIAPAAVGGIVSPGNPAAAQLAQVDAAISTAERTLGPNHPDLQAMRQQRAAIASAAAASRPVISGGAPAGPSLASLYGAQQAKVLAQRGKVNEARQLATDVVVLRDQYQRIMARTAELQLQGEASDSGLTLLGSAVAPEDPVFPNWPLLIFGSLGLGAAIGVLMSLLVELLGRRVRGIEDLRHESVPVLGMMTPMSGDTSQERFWHGFWPRRLRAEPAL